MPYEPIEQIRSRADEKIALFLTARHVVGLLGGGLPAFLITIALPFLLRVIIIALAAGVGVMLTLDVRGLAGYERIIWRVRGMLQARTRRPRITPHDLVGPAVNVDQRQTPVRERSPFRRIGSARARSSRVTARANRTTTTQVPHALDQPAPDASVTTPTTAGALTDAHVQTHQLSD